MNIKNREIRVNVATLYSVMGQPMAYQPEFARTFKSVPAAVLLSYLIHWVGKGKDPDGWIYKSQDEIEADTGLSKDAQRTARKKLRGLLVLYEKIEGMDRRMSYNVDVEQTFFLVDEAVARKWRTSTLQSGGHEPLQSGEPQLCYKKQERTSGKNGQEIADLEKQPLPPHLQAIEDGTTQAELFDKRLSKVAPVGADEDIPQELKTSLVNALLAHTGREAVVHAGDDRILGYAHQDISILWKMGVRSVTVLDDLVIDWRQNDWRGQRGDHPSGMALKTWMSEKGTRAVETTEVRTIMVGGVKQQVIVTV